MPQYILKVYCHQYSVIAVYTANLVYASTLDSFKARYKLLYKLNLVYHILQLSGYPAYDHTAHTLQHSSSIPAVLQTS